MVRIEKYGKSAILSAKAELVTAADISSGRLEDWSKKLLKGFLELSPIQGLAAPQVGLSVCVILCRIKGKPVLMVNPAVISTFGNNRSNEGCESVKGRYYVDRPVFGKVRYMDIRGNVRDRLLSRKYIRIVCHEIDHLEGKCLPDVGKEV